MILTLRDSQTVAEIDVETVSDSWVGVWWGAGGRGFGNKRRKYLPLPSEQGGGVSYRKLGGREWGLCLSPIRKDNESLPDRFVWTSSEF